MIIPERLTAAWRRHHLKIIRILGNSVAFFRNLSATTKRFWGVVGLVTLVSGVLGTWWGGLAWGCAVVGVVLGLGVLPLGVFTGRIVLIGRRREKRSRARDRERELLRDRERERAEEDLPAATVAVVMPEGLVEMGTANAVDERWVRFGGFETVAKREGATSLTRRGRPLVGRVLAVSVFLGKDGRSWSDYEIASTYEAILESARWVAREAKVWGVDAHAGVDVSGVYFVADDEVTEESEESEDAALVMTREGEGMGLWEATLEEREQRGLARVAAALGWADAVDWFQDVRRRALRTGHVPVWFLHLARQGRSHAIAPDRAVVPDVHLAVCYAREAGLPLPLPDDLAARPDPTTLAHEMLHLFGASDKYGVPLRVFPPGDVTQRDIMRLAVNSLRHLQIDPLTAREIGWDSQNDSKEKRP